MDNEIRMEQKSKPRCSMAGQTMVPAASQEAPSPTMSPAPVLRRVPAPWGAGGCHWNMHLIGYLSAFLGGYEVQPLPEAIMGCNNEAALPQSSFD